MPLGPTHQVRAFVAAGDDVGVAKQLDGHNSRRSAIDLWGSFPGNLAVSVFLWEAVVCPSSSTEQRKKRPAGLAGRSFDSGSGLSTLDCFWARLLTA
jgi:hypothetical protein